jgi:hypothetical protein
MCSVESIGELPNILLIIIYLSVLKNRKAIQKTRNNTF